MSDPKPVPAPAHDDHADDAPLYDDGDDLDEDDGLDECMLGSDGQCGLAGSEWCDWECPLRNSEFFAGSEAWNKKHARKP